MNERPVDIERRVRRWQEQRWILDSVVRTVGIEWDQPRIAYTLGPCGPEATADLHGVRNRVRRFSDITREYERAARRREGTARALEDDGCGVSAGESYFIASLLYGSAQWPIFAITDRNRELDARKVDCYRGYLRHADHEIRPVEIPFGGGELPGYFHLPPQAGSSRLPAVLGISGMDTFKEMRHAIYGDKLLQRGFASLAIDGPGQGEALVSRDIRVTESNFIEAGRAAVDWLRKQPQVDPGLIFVSGASFGSFWATQIAAAVEGLAGCAVAFVCHEPGCHTLFNMASPTFKLRFMYMAGFESEEDFDRWSAELDLRTLAASVDRPYLAVAGEDDELSPIECTYDLLAQMPGTKELLVYQGEPHGLHATTATALGPNPQRYIADWLRSRADGRPLRSTRRFVDLAGNMTVESW